MPATALHTKGAQQGPIHIEQEHRVAAEPGYRIIRRNGTVTRFSVTVAGLGAGVISISLGAFVGAVAAFLFVAALARAAGGGVTL